MDGDLRRAGAVGAVAFVLVSSVLTLLRSRVPGGVQSTLVYTSAVLLFFGIAAYACSGGEPVPAFLLAFGPSAGFTVNLFLSGEPESLTTLTFYGLVVGVAGLFTLFGYVAGRATLVLLAENEELDP